MWPFDHGLVNQSNYRPSAHNKHTRLWLITVCQFPALVVKRVEFVRLCFHGDTYRGKGIVSVWFSRTHVLMYRVNVLWCLLNGAFKCKHSTLDVDSSVGSVNNNNGADGIYLTRILDLCNVYNWRFNQKLLIVTGDIVLNWWNGTGSRFSIEILSCQFRNSIIETRRSQDRIVSYTRACETSAGCLRSIYPSLGMRQLFGDVTIGQWRHN